MIFASARNEPFTASPLGGAGDVRFEHDDVDSLPITPRVFATRTVREIVFHLKVASICLAAFFIRPSSAPARRSRADDANIVASVNIGSHMGFDATRKLPGENYHREWPELVKMTEEAQRLVDALRK